MDEARSLQYSIEVKADTAKAEQNIQNLISQCGRLRTETADVINVNAEADIFEAERNIRGLAEDLVTLRSESENSGIIINADTSEARGNVYDLTEDISSINSADVTVDADTSEAEESIRDLTEDIGSIAPDDVTVDVDTEQAQSDVRNLSDDIADLGNDSPDIDLDVDTSEAERNIRDLTDDIGDLENDADSIGSAFRSSFLAGIDSGDSFASSLRSGVGGAFTYASEQISEFRDNAVSKIQGAVESISSGAQSIGNSFAHPIETIRNGLGEALQNARERAIDFISSMGNASESTENFNQSASSLRQTISTQEAELQSLKQAYVDFALSENTSSDEAQSLAQQISDLGSDLQENRNRLQNAENAADQLGDSLDDVGDSAAGADPDVENLGNTAENSGSKFEKLGNILGSIGKAAAVGLAAATTTVAAFAASSVSVGMNFDSSMSQVAATMGFTVEELNTEGSEAAETFETLRSFAQEMGASTAFSATEAADALNYMALAGYDAETSMAMLPNVLNLAAAGGIDLASASDMVTDAQSALGLSLDETNQLVDKMASTASKTNTSVAQLGEAILTVGGTAQYLSGGTTELSAALGVLADNGIKGAEGGTHLRNIILSLSSPTADASSTLKQLGVEVFDAEGKMRNLADVFPELNEAMSSMTDAEQLDVLSTLFNTTDLSAANALLGTSVDRWNELGEAIGDCEGAAGEMANVQLDNLEGDITLFKSALEGAQIAISDELSPALREFTQFGTNSISKLTAAFQEGGLSGAMSAFGTILSDALAMIIDMLPSLIDAGMQLISALGQGIIDNLPTITQAAAEIIVTLASGLGEALPEMIPAVVDALVLVSETIIENLPLVLEAGMSIISGLAEGIINAIPLLIEALPELILSIVNFLTENLPTILEQGVQIITTFAMGIINAIPDLVAQLPIIITSIVDFITSNLPLIIETGINIIVQLGVGLIQAIPQLVANASTVLSSLVSAFKAGIGSFLSIGKSIVEGIWNGISSAASWLYGKVASFASSIVGKVKGALGINSPSKVFAGIGCYMAEGLGEGFTNEMASVEKDIEKAVPTELDLPNVNYGVADNTAVPDVSYHVSPIMDDIAAQNVGDVSYHVSPIMDNIAAQNVGDVSYHVSPIMDDIAAQKVGDVSYHVSPIMDDIAAQNVGDVSYHASPIMDDIAAQKVGDVSYHVSPIMDDIAAQKVSNVTYGVTPVVGDFTPPDASTSFVYSGDTKAENSDSTAETTDTSAAPTFAPVITIQVQGSADSEVIEDMRTSLYDTVRELFQNFREEELERQSLKNQYAFV